MRFSCRMYSKSYLECSYCSPTCQPVIDNIVKEFHLNQEQERAFQIIANHSSNQNSEQLRMYIGGMGGMGKTQVLRALSQFFDQ